MRVPKESHHSISSATPLLTGSGQTVSWGFYLPEGSVINTQNSYLHYKVKFTFKTQTSNNQNGTTPQTIGTDPEALTALVPGRYTIVDSMLYCEPAILDNAALTFSKFGPGKFIC